MANQFTITHHPTSYSTSGTIKGTAYKNAIGKGSDATGSGNDYASSSGSTATITYAFDFSEIPVNATITSVSVVVGGHCENTSKSTARADLQLYSGSTAKGTAAKFTSTSKQLVTMSAGTWTRAELQDAKLAFTIGYYGGLVNGVDFSVTYTLTAIEGSVRIGGSWKGIDNMWVRVANSWKEVDSVYTRINGAWKSQ